MKEFKWINIMNIKIDKVSLSVETLDLAMKIRNGEIDINDLPPITVELKNGTIGRVV